MYHSISTFFLHCVSLSLYSFLILCVCLVASFISFCATAIWLCALYADNIFLFYAKEKIFSRDSSRNESNFITNFSMKKSIPWTFRIEINIFVDMLCIQKHSRDGMNFILSKLLNYVCLIESINLKRNTTLLNKNRFILFLIRQRGKERENKQNM